MPNEAASSICCIDCCIDAGDLRRLPGLARVGGRLGLTGSIEPGIEPVSPGKSGGDGGEKICGGNGGPIILNVWPVSVSV
tara:strand:- start:1304 stop:1543 length:240 start_codon:yes stop_codon:yes gene_type:complete